MTAHAEPRTPPADLNALQEHFLAILPRVEAHARVRFRYLRRPGRRDDAVAEAVAVAWKWYLRLNEKGRDAGEFVGTLADYAVRHVRSGRRLCGQERARDALSPSAQCRKGFKVESLPSSTRVSHDALFGDPHGQGHADALEERLRDNTRSPVPEQAAFRVDYPEWLSRLGGRERGIARDMALELGTLEVATRHGVSPGRVSQLRRELHADYGRFHGEPAAC